MAGGAEQRAALCHQYNSFVDGFYNRYLLPFPKVQPRKFDPVHIANSTLAGGVAIGSAARLNIGPGYAVVTGVLAGTAIVYGYVYSSPMLESKFDIFDTCDVGNLYGYPSLVGALLSVASIALDSEAD